MYNKQKKMFFMSFVSFYNFFSEVVSYLSDSYQNAKNKLLYKIITAKW